MGKSNLAMEIFVRLFNEWEIQLLVLLSFMLQAFLFFAGGLRRRTSNRMMPSLEGVHKTGSSLGTIPPHTPWRTGHDHRFRHRGQQPLAEAFAESFSLSRPRLVYLLEGSQ
uniref:Uncharacterized protein n=1 Tax=Arundo donax TaxID=35708 RepID=A0A0A9AD51_ARUDO